MPLSTTLDSFGPIGVSVACCALVDRILAGLEPRVPAARPLEGLRLGVLTHFVTDGVEPAVAAALDAALKHLEAAGAVVADVRFAPLDRLPEINRFGFASLEAYAWHRPLIAERRDDYDPRVLTRILKGEPARAADYLDLLAERAAMVDAAQSRRPCRSCRRAWPTATRTTPHSRVSTRSFCAIRARSIFSTRARCRCRATRAARRRSGSCSPARRTETMHSLASGSRSSGC